jgi:hypothetical protein
LGYCDVQNSMPIPQILIFKNKNKNAPRTQCAQLT